MKKKFTRIFSGALCVLLVMLTGVIAFAEGGYDTPTIPIHSHVYTYTVVTPAACTEPGVKLGTCDKCGKTTTKSINPVGHLRVLGSSQTYEGVEIACRYCDTTEIKTAAELAQMWGAQYINKRPIRGNEGSYEYLDLDGNNIINAKDYAILVKLQYNEEKLIQRHNQSLNGSETIEDLYNADYYPLP